MQEPIGHCRAKESTVFACHGFLACNLGFEAPVVTEAARKSCFQTLLRLSSLPRPDRRTRTLCRLCSLLPGP
ncbi:unnamed protein product, partial [Symbiodinium sp. CCMP2456]